MDINNEITIEALTENLPMVMSFVNENLEKADCPLKEKMQIDLAVEEIFVNIASYAYTPKTGDAVIRMDKAENSSKVTITFSDKGVPYNPLEKEDPDVTLSAEERPVGGLGIFMVKKSMDDMFYEYKDGQNNLTIIKTF